MLLTGDIGEALDVEPPDAELGMPLDSVLGNHDYHGSGTARAAPAPRSGAPARPG